MIDKTFIGQTVDEILHDSSLFLVDVKVSSRNKIMVFLDGDDGVPISECVRVSRHIESLLDRDAEDFELEVSSVGLDKPLKLLRQFKKNIGREVMIEDIDGGKIKGKLVDAQESFITIEKPLPKKKKSKDAETEEPILKLPFEQIKEVKVMVSFKKSKE